MINYSKYYDGIFERAEFLKNVQLIETTFYDLWTGELKKNGSPFKQIEEYENENLIYFSYEHIQGENKTKRELFINWKNEKIESIREKTNSSEFITNFEYDNKGLLISEIKNSFKEDEPDFYEGYKFTYQKTDNSNKLKRIDKLIRIPGEINLGQVFSSEIKYDNLGRIKEVISPVHSRDPQFDYTDKKMVLKHIYYTKSKIIEVQRKYSNSEKIFDNYYYQLRNKKKYYSKDRTVNENIEFDKNGNLIKNGGMKLKYTFDRNNNWIEKYDKGKLVAKRKLKYRL